MAKGFEDLQVWQISRQLVNSVYGVTRNNGFRKDFALTDQVRRAAVSVLSNIAEGFERGSNTEFIQFLYISKGSAAEVRAQLYVALDQEYISRTDFEKTISLCKDVSNQLSGFISYIKNSGLKGQKFKTQNPKS